MIRIIRPIHKIMRIIQNFKDTGRNANMQGQENHGEKPIKIFL